MKARVFLVGARVVDPPRAISASAGCSVNIQLTFPVDSAANLLPEQPFALVLAVLASAA